MPFLMSFATQPEIVTFAWIDNAFMQFPLNFYATKGSTYTSYEGEREWPTDGRKHKHPIQEAAEAERRLISRAAEEFDEFQILRFRATNVAPFPFEWAALEQTAKEYGALLIRVSREYDRRFP